MVASSIGKGWPSIGVDRTDEFRREIDVVNDKTEKRETEIGP